jgi:primosomal protein N' (replication factor Y)
VIGTRAAALAPVADLGLVAIWDDGDDLHAEPRAPIRTPGRCCSTRAELAGCAAWSAASPARPRRSSSSRPAGRTSWARPRRRARPRPARRPGRRRRRAGPRSRRRAARLPTLAWRAARAALGAGAPVLVQVPRRGYLPAVACARCGAPARCRHCQGPLGLPSATGIAACRWCGRAGGRPQVRRLRRPADARLGDRGPAAPRGARAARSPGAGAHVRARRRARPRARRGGARRLHAGAEPVAAGGYGAVLLLDSWALLTRADLRATEEAVRRWFARPRWPGRPRAGGQVVVMADGGSRRRAGAAALGRRLARRPGAGRAARAGLPAGRPDRVR